MVPPALVKIVGQDSTNRLSIVAPRKMYGTFPVLAGVPPRVKVLDTYSVSLREPSGATQSNCRVVGDLASFLWGRPWKDSRMCTVGRAATSILRRKSNGAREMVRYVRHEICDSTRSPSVPWRRPAGVLGTEVEIRRCKSGVKVSTSDRVDASVDIYAVEEHFESMKPSKLDGVQHIVHTGVLLIDWSSPFRVKPRPGGRIPRKNSDSTPSPRHLSTMWTCSTTDRFDATSRESLHSDHSYYPYGGTAG
ncbi:uncharacterized protein CC84DRAFT_1208407 [Paraphaeosphaeria sporulosa]|uniref:Uncharacterized protein n=1 Tax=Paraphaeosphaeria sporulosa TaxID=1460663 RepID=A0A177C4N5_9PLEO|nr:uncharacterized protein CC84DRAFT_1208407 [Paraphaeosphaeria sporulosa]OAG02386.1 hypothetical protein CC84DRAFT_1208407 [Paraphaeosphaeria sporulosa]